MLQFHWNAETVGVWGCNLFTVVEGFGLFFQIRQIWKKRSGESVSVGMMLFLTTLCVSSIVYGLTYHRRPIVFNGTVLGIGFSAVAVGLWRFKGYRPWERWFGLGLVASLAAMFITGHFDRWYFLYSAGSAAALALQPLEIWRKRSSGVVDIRLLLLFFTSNTFWVIYAFAVRDWVLMSLCPIYVLTLGLAIALWWKFRQRS